MQLPAVGLGQGGKFLLMWQPAGDAESGPSLALWSRSALAAALAARGVAGALIPRELSLRVPVHSDVSHGEFCCMTPKHQF